MEGGPNLNRPRAEAPKTPEMSESFKKLAEVIDFKKHFVAANDNDPELTLDEWKEEHAKKLEALATPYKEVAREFLEGFDPEAKMAA